MNLALVLGVHGNSDVVFDTIDAIRTYVTQDILVIVDGMAWDWATEISFPAYKMEGFVHGCHKSPYRNVALGLNQAFKMWPNADWYCYCEYDVLFTSDKFKSDLEDAGNQGGWCIGNCLRTEKRQFPLLEKITGLEFEIAKYLLGCCVFYKVDLFHKLAEIDFFDRFLWYTNPFQKGFFPCDKDVYDPGEYIYPTIANYFGGKVGQFASWDETANTWYGSYEKYPMRWKPEISEISTHASIIHPSKDYDHPIRHLQRMKRNAKLPERI